MAWFLAFSVGFVKTFRRACISSLVQTNLVQTEANATDEATSPRFESQNLQRQFDGFRVFSAGIFVAVFVLPSILLAFIYGRIYMEAHKNLVRIR